MKKINVYKIIQITSQKVKISKLCIFIPVVYKAKLGILLCFEIK